MFPNWFNRQNTGLADDEIAALKREMAREVTQRPPTIGLVGVSGVGKSSTINAMFKTSLPVSDTVACTKEFSATDLSMKLVEGHGKGMHVQLRVFDAPGLGESISMDPGYLEMYNNTLPECDVILWVMGARNRAMALDQSYLQRLQRFHDKIVFGINQIDLIEPRNWNEKIGLPSDEQFRKIDEIEEDRRSKLRSILGSDVSVTSFSAHRKFNLEHIFGNLIDKLPKERRWVFDGLKNFHYTDFLPEAVRDQFR